MGNGCARLQRRSAMAVSAAVPDVAGNMLNWETDGVPGDSFREGWTWHPIVLDATSRVHTFTDADGDRIQTVFRGLGEAWAVQWRRCGFSEFLVDNAPDYREDMTSRYLRDSTMGMQEKTRRKGISGKGTCRGSARRVESVQRTLEGGLCRLFAIGRAIGFSFSEAVRSVGAIGSTALRLRRLAESRR